MPHIRHISLNGVALVYVLGSQQGKRNTEYGGDLLFGDSVSVGVVYVLRVCRHALRLQAAGEQSELARLLESAVNLIDVLTQPLDSRLIEVLRRAENKRHYRVVVQYGVLEYIELIIQRNRQLCRLKRSESVKVVFRVGESEMGHQFRLKLLYVSFLLAVSVGLDPL